MKEKEKWAFILDKDEFVRLSLNKILKKYGFEVEEIENLSVLEKRKKEIKSGMILADLEIETLEGWLSLLRRWNDRFIFMSPHITDDLTHRLKQAGILRILRKPVEPRSLRKMIRQMSLSDEGKLSSPVKKRGGFPIQSERR